MYFGDCLKMHSHNSNGVHEGERPFNWLIPPELIGFTLEDYYNSQDHHYGVRCSTLDQIQESDTGWQGRLDTLLSRRLRKVPKMFDETQSAMELPSNRREKGSLFELLCNTDI